MFTRKIFELEIGECDWLGSVGYYRVPGGWVMCHLDQERDIITSSVFIPYSNEFPK